MNKYIIVIIIILTFFVEGCTNKLDNSENGTNELINGETLETTSKFEKAQYDKFNSYADENGLGGKLIHIDAVVERVEDVDQYKTFIVNEKANQDNKWLVLFVDTENVDDKKIDNLIGKSAQIYGEYLGKSSKLEMPCLNIIGNDYYFQMNDGTKITTSYFNNSTENEDAKNEKIDEFVYEYDTDNTLTVLLQKDKMTDKLSVFSYGKYTAENLGLMQIDFLTISVGAILKSLDFSYIATVGENAYMYTSSNNKVILNTVPTADIKTIPEIYEDDTRKVVSGINELYVRNGIMEKTYNTLVYEDKKVKIYFTGVDDKGVKFQIENLTDHTVTIQAKTIAINGKSTNSIIMSDSIAAKSIGTATAKCKDFSTIDNFKTITGELRIISDDWKNYYSANFVNVEIK